MVDHIELGGEVLALDFSTLLCDRCKAAMEAAKEAQRALQALNALTGGKPHPPALPAVASVPGRLLGREERLEKAKALLKREAAMTSGGTILAAAPHQYMPRIKLKKRAENDLAHVEAGRMSKKEWCRKHGHHPSVLEKRLKMMHGSGIPANYTPPQFQLTSEQYDDILNGEISGNKLAKQLGLPAGTVYRLVEKEKRRRQHERGAQTRMARVKERPKDGAPYGFTHDGRPRIRRAPGEISVTDEELAGIYDGKLTQNEIAKKYDVGASMISRRYDEYCARNRLEPRKRGTASRPAIEIDPKDLVAFINGQVKGPVLAEKYGCTTGVVSIRAKNYALRYGIISDEKQAEEREEERGDKDPQQLFEGLQRVLAD